eukprot:CAMPEP_0119121702 /NCGR_PEP_ID=MMETSP1310-20130426/2210_1 /TAXON_ID=464262 /ORGANISM="Genus nov. species nov., Strain RCC2339" /LENGTH=331 /DNA_ID=CAMNT_0007111279 /DNA_START=34 /DNA_END=1029 /DNA_ORIENTATION=-
MAIEISPVALVGTVSVVVVVAVAVRYFSQGMRSASIVPARKREDDEDDEDEPMVFLNRTAQYVPLAEKIDISHDTKLFRFSLPASDVVLGLPIGKHLKIFGPNTTGVEANMWNGREDQELGKAEISRPYTPTSSDDDRGHFDLVVKVYRGGVIDRFPDGGKMSQYLDSLHVGDKVKCQGPYGLIEYHGGGVFSQSRKKKAPMRKVSMIAGGTGITPMLQVITAILKEADSAVNMSLLFANQTKEDILLHEKLQELQQTYPDRLSVWYTLDRPPQDWEYSTGFINADMIRDHIAAPGPDSVVLLCGPPPMIKYACEPNLLEVGHKKENILTF